MGADIKQFNRRVNYLISETDAVYHEIALHFGFSDSEMMILYALTDNAGACPLSSLYRQTGSSKQTVSSALRRLEASGVICLRPADKKSKIVCLTDSGEALAAQTAGRVLEMENEIYASWPEDELENYLRLTQKYLDELRKKSNELERERL